MGGGYFYCTTILHIPESKQCIEEFWGIWSVGEYGPLGNMVHMQ